MAIHQDEQFFIRMEKLRQAVSEVLPGTDAAAEIEDLCRKFKASYREVRALAKTNRSPLVAVVTESAATRRWIINSLQLRLSQQLGLDREPLANEVEGFGPVRPDWLPMQSHFDTISASQWNGVSPWSCVAVAPSVTERIDADLVLYVVDFEDLQNHATARAVYPFAGIPIVPIVLKVTPRGKADLRAFSDRLDTVLDNSASFPLLAFPDYDDKRVQSNIADAEQKIWDQCQGHVDASESKRQQIQEERCDKIQKRFEVETKNILLRSDFKKINDAIDNLKEKERLVLRDQTMKWISGNDDLRTPIRIRLRLIACEITPAFCFPFRSIIGVLAITSGVWDRLAMAMLGSPVALALAAYQSGGQLWSNRNSLHELTADADEQFGRTVIGELEDAFRETRRAITNQLPGSKALTDVNRENLRVKGSESLLQDVRSILDRNCRQDTPLRAIRITATACTVVFLILFSGPIIALYGDYVCPLLHVWSGKSDGIESFPLPELSRIFTGFVLGVIPGIIAGMLLLASLTRTSVITRLTDRTRGEINRQIDSMIADKRLSLEGMDESFNQIRFLNSVMNAND